MIGRDPGIGIDEEKNLAPRDAGSGVAGGGDLPAIDGHDTGAKLPGDFRSRIGRGVVDHNQLISLLRGIGGDAQRAQGGGQLELFVMRRDDKRELRGRGRKIFLQRSGRRSRNPAAIGWPAGRRH